MLMWLQSAHFPSLLLRGSDDALLLPSAFWCRPTTRIRQTVVCRFSQTSFSQTMNANILYTPLPFTCKPTKCRQPEQPQCSSSSFWSQQCHPTLWKDVSPSKGQGNAEENGCWLSGRRETTAEGRVKVRWTVPILLPRLSWEELEDLWTCTGAWKYLSNQQGQKSSVRQMRL